MGSAEAEFSVEAGEGKKDVLPAPCDIVKIGPWITTLIGVMKEPEIARLGFEAPLVTRSWAPALTSAQAIKKRISIFFIDTPKLYKTTLV
jgi:hypothetical protein